MMRRNFLLFICALALGCLAGCSVHEFTESGEQGASVALSLEIRIDDVLLLQHDIRYATKATETAARYIVRFYPVLMEGFSTKAAFEFTMTEADLRDRTYSLPVAPMDYHIEVWADWISGATDFYDTADFGSIEVSTKPYAGAEELRDAYCGSLDLDLSPYHSAHSIATASVTLHRPLARLRFLSTDKEDFLRYWASQLAILDGTNVKDPDAIDLGSFRVVVTYPQYMPSVYNLHDGTVVDSATGVSFESRIKELADGNLELAWDWIFVYGDDASVVVNISVFDDKGRPVVSLDDIQVPLTPGASTTVTGELLSSHIDSGIHIDPSFDGETIIEI